MKGYEIMNVSACHRWVMSSTTYVSGVSAHLRS
jgi:hypothetical protein